MLRLFAVVSVLLLHVSTCQAADRLALVIANARYTVLPKLVGPEQDAKTISAALRGLGFKVVVLADLDARGIKRAVSDHAEALWQAGAGSIGLIHFSGHGIAEQGQRANYLLPVDIAGVDERYLRDEAVSLAHVVERLKITGVANFIVLDTCRDELTRVRGFRGGTDEPALQPGFFVAASTQAGNAAIDGGAGGSPYSRALALALSTRCADYLSIFKSAQINVSQWTNGAQTPWMADGLPALFALDASCKVPATAASGTSPTIPKVPTGPLRIAVGGAADALVLAHVRLALRDALPGATLADAAGSAAATHDLTLTASDARSEQGTCGWQVVRPITYELFDRATGEDVLRGEVRGTICYTQSDIETMVVAATRTAARNLARDLNAKIERLGK